MASNGTALDELGAVGALKARNAAQGELGLVLGLLPVTLKHDALDQLQLDAVDLGRGERLREERCETCVSQGSILQRERA